MKTNQEIIDYCNQEIRTAKDAHFECQSDLDGRVEAVLYQAAVKIYQDVIDFANGRVEAKNILVS